MYKEELVSLLSASLMCSRTQTPFVTSLCEVALSNQCQTPAFQSVFFLLLPDELTDARSQAID